MTNHHINCAVLCTVLGLAAMPAHAAAGKKNLEVVASAGMGYNSNAYRSPSASYVDLANAASPTVVPNVQSGLYIPMSLDARYELDSGVVLDYSLNSEYFLGSSLQNANSVSQALKVGKTVDLKEGSLAGSQAYVGFLYKKHKQIYYDRDSGAEKLSPTSLTNLSNRYNYSEIGAEAQLSKKVDGVEYDLNGTYAMLNYDTPVVSTLSSLDHTLMQFGGSARFPLQAKKMKLQLGYDYTSRDYSNRNARNSTGNLLKANGLLAYTYHDLSAQLYWRMAKETKVFVDVIHGTRADNYVSYNDYSKDTFKLRVRHKLSDVAFVRGKLAYAKTNYKNAFAFENPAAARKTANSLTASVKGEYEITQYGAPALWANLAYSDYSSNDLRYNYKVTELVVGGDWKF